VVIRSRRWRRRSESPVCGLAVTDSESTPSASVMSLRITSCSHHDPVFSRRWKPGFSHGEVVSSHTNELVL